MTPEQMEDECRAFEKFYAFKNPNETMHSRVFDKRGHCYVYDIVQDFFEFWLAAKQHECEKKQWYKISDGVPYGTGYPRDKVLVINKYGEIKSGYFDGDAEAFCYDGSSNYEDDPEYLTHWRYLPELPEKDSKND